MSLISSFLFFASIAPSILSIFVVIYRSSSPTNFLLFSSIFANLFFPVFTTLLSSHSSLFLLSLSSSLSPLPLYLSVGYISIIHLKVLLPLYQWLVCCVLCPVQYSFKAEHTLYSIHSICHLMGFQHIYGDSWFYLFFHHHFSCPFPSYSFQLMLYSIIQAYN